MDIREAIFKALSPETRAAEGYAEADRALGVAIAAHPEWPIICNTAKELLEKFPEATFNMLVRFGYDVRGILGTHAVGDKNSAVSWCEALFNLNSTPEDVKLRLGRIALQGNNLEPLTTDNGWDEDEGK